MSDVLDTDVAPFCHGQNHSGSVPVPTVGVTAVRAPEVSLVQFESFGSRETPAACHGRVCGSDHHHLPPGPPGTLDEFTLGRADRGISSIARHGGLRQELWLEVLGGDQMVVVDNAFGPHTRVVNGSQGRSLRQPGNMPPGIGVAPRLRTALAVTSRHCALRSRQLRSASPAMAEMWEIEGRGGGGRRGGHTPIDPDVALAVRMRLDLTAHDERGIPMPQAVPAHTHRRRLARQLPGPHNRNRNTLRQDQTTFTDREPSPRVLQRRQRTLAGLDLRTTTPLHREGLIQRSRVITQHLLLGDLRTFAQPQHRRSCLGQQLPEPRERRLPTRSLLMDRLVPQPSTTPPLGHQRCLGSAPGPKPVRVPHHLIHSNILSKDAVMRHKRHPHLLLSAVNDDVSKADAR